MYNILQPTLLPGWYDVEGEITKLIADGINTDIQLTALEGVVSSLVPITNTLQLETIELFNQRTIL
jgi:hypothetical protein